MPFATALSGLNAAATDLQTTGNNIANANTVGFKKSRAEFADVYASSLFGAGKSTPGSGVRVTEVAQMFTQGNLEYTENVLDLAISGRGFFALTDSINGEPTAFTRNGAFQLNKDGYIVTDQGKYLYGRRADAAGTQGALRVETTKGKPQATNAVKLNINLNATETTPAVTPFDPTKAETYNQATSVTVYDSLGNPHTITSYFVSQNPSTPNTWEVYQYIDGNSFGGPTTLAFNTNGALISVDGTAGQTKATYGPYAITGADPLTITYDFANSTQFSSDFSINAMSQNGFPAGDFVGLEINDDGKLYARFSNGNNELLGQIMLASFKNEQGLSKLGNSMWGESNLSGPKLLAAPGSNNLGTLQSGALEASNVDLSKQLVRLIVAQQSYQANAQTISTEDQVIQTLLNLR